MTRIVDGLLQGGRLWRGDAAVYHPPAGIASGFAELDSALHGGGWPAAGSTELLGAQPGIGELSLLAPALAALSRQQRIAWLNPPCIPYAPALAAAGVRPEACLVVRARGLRDQLWAAEQLLRAQAFAAVLTWFERDRLADKDLRRLQLAAREGQCWHVHFRAADCLQQSSPAPLRLVLTAEANGLALHIAKQPGGRSGQHLRIPRDPRLLHQQIPATDWPVYRRQRLQRIALRPALTLVDSPPHAKDGEAAGLH